MKQTEECYLSRFGGEFSSDWRCRGEKHDALTFKLSTAATLTSVGLFGTESAREIPVKVEILNTELESIFSTSL